MPSEPDHSGKPPESGLIGVPTERLVALLYDELRSLARARIAAERPGHTLTATALVHEAFVRLNGKSDGWSDKESFFAAAAEAMRRILVDMARRRRAIKRGGGHTTMALDTDVEPSLVSIGSLADGIDLEALDSALTGLERTDPRRHRVVMLRFFAGLTEEEIASVLDVNVKTVKRDWQAARLWLFSQMKDDGSGTVP